MDDNFVVLHHMIIQLEEELDDVEDDGIRVFERINPFLISDTKFVKLFRLSKDLVRQVIDMLQPFMGQATRTSEITNELKVFIALHFYAHGNYQECVSKTLFNAVSQASVSRAIHEVTDALNNQILLDRFIRFPADINEMRQQRFRFERKYDFPGIVGVIDCTHVAIVTPVENEHVFVNRKNFHSLNVQIICDENLLILNVNATFPGSCHKSHIWNQSNVSRLLEQVYRHNPNEHFYLLGDSGYPLRPWLLTPLEAEPQPKTANERFNNRLKSVQSTVERCIGVLKKRFRCLLKNRVLHYAFAPITAGKIVNACVILHNMCIKNNLPEPEEPEEINVEIEVDEVPQAGQEHIMKRINADLVAGINLQAYIANKYFL